MNEFQCINKATKVSDEQYRDQVVVVFKNFDGSYGLSLESEFFGDEDRIKERYLNGRLIPLYAL
jgi:hypothetical protein